jgi:hypothetical protein
MFLRLFINYIIFFLQLCLSFQSFSTNPFSPISPTIPSAQVSLGLPRFLLPGGRHFINYFGNLPSISSNRYLVTFILCLIVVFQILSFLEILVERRQKSISVKFSDSFFTCSTNHHFVVQLIVSQYSNTNVIHFSFSFIEN